MLYEAYRAENGWRVYVCEASEVGLWLCEIESKVCDCNELESANTRVLKRRDPRALSLLR